MPSEIAKKIWQLEWSDGPHQVDAELTSVRECLDQCDRALRSLPQEALGRDAQQGYYYRDELLKRVMLTSDRLRV